MPARSDCSDIQPGEAAPLPVGFLGVKLEGDNHGPVDLAAGDLNPVGNGAFGVTVPRKAFLEVTRRPLPADASKVSLGSAVNAPISVALYRPGAPSFHDPFYRGSELGNDNRIKVPAGQFVTALSAGRDAPQLQRMTIAPGATVRVTYVPRTGWSAVLRFRAAANGKPVAGAAARLIDGAGYGAPGRSIGEGISDSDGLVLVSGISAALASVNVAHSSFLPSEIHGLAAAAGDLAFREVALSSGSHLKVTVSLQARPVNAAKCELEAFSSEAVKRAETFKPLWSSQTDAHGSCRSPALPPGLYRLKVQPPGSASAALRWLELRDGQDLAEDFLLTPIRIGGMVRHGSNPAPDYTVRALPVFRDAPSGAPASAAGETKSDSDGRYELTFWTPGLYIVTLRDAAQSTVGGRKMVDLSEGEDKHLDFDLGTRSVSGRVIDQSSAPVSGAMIVLQWQSATSASRTDEQGQFQIDIADTGTGSVQAKKYGYTDSQETGFQVTDDGPALPPFVLQVTKQSGLQGTVVSASGTPVAGAMVTSVSTSTGEAFATTHSQADGTFTVPVLPGAVRLFVSGPQCPLFSLDLAAPDQAADATDGSAGDSASGSSSQTQLVQCSDQAGSIDAMVQSARPQSRVSLILRRDGIVVPPNVMAQHLGLLGLPGQLIGSGHLLLAFLSPAHYDIFLASTTSSVATVASGSPEGLMSSVAVQPGDTAQVNITLPANYPRLN